MQVLPLSHPLRLAEEAATVDQISHGRLIYGIGRSGVVRTYEDYGISYAESRERFAETLEVLKRPGPSRASRTRQVLLLRQRRADPEAVPDALSADAHGRGRRLRPSRRSAGGIGGLCRGAAGAVLATGGAYQGVSRGVARGGPSGRGQGVSCGCRPISPRRGSAPAPRPRKA